MIPFDGARCEAALQSPDRPVVLLFSAVWCGPCRTFGPTVERVVASLGERVVAGKVDTDAHPDLAARWGVRSLPTLVVVQGGEPVARQVGSVSEGAVRRLIEGALSTSAHAPSGA